MIDNFNLRVCEIKVKRELLVSVSAFKREQKFLVMTRTESLIGVADHKQETLFRFKTTV